MPTKKQKRPGSQWTVVFLNREGFPMPIQKLDRQGRPMGGVDRFLTDNNTERGLLNEVEAIMLEVGRGKSEKVGLSSDVYVAGVWAGKHENFPHFIETIRPRFYVYEGGQTHIVT